MRRINSAPHRFDAELNFIKIPANEKVQPNSCTFCGSLNRCPCVVEGDDDAVLCGDLIYLSDELGRVDVQKLYRERFLLLGAHRGENALDDLLGKLGRRADALANQRIHAFAFGQNLYQVGQERIKRFGVRMNCMCLSKISV